MCGEECSSQKNVYKRVKHGFVAINLRGKNRACSDFTHTVSLTKKKF